MSATVGELVRFAVVALAGLVVDIAVAWSLAVPFGFDLVLAATIGFSCGAAVNYVLHEVWTFQQGARQVSAFRAARYLGALGVTLVARLTAVAVLSWLLKAEGQELVILIGATGVSFFVNYAVSKLFVFRSVSLPGAAEDAAREDQDDR
ncbi:MAG: GtrA family protein [Rhodobacteraceae bacterium]|nr:GtrA family protein [Paracoccaceae bacterium]